MCVCLPRLCGKIKDKHQFCKKCLVDPVASGMATAARAPRPSLKAVIESTEDSSATPEAAHAPKAGKRRRKNK